MSSYIHYGWGPHACLGLDASRLALATMLKTVARLDNLRRAPGAPGRMRTFVEAGGFRSYLTADGSSYFPLPTGLRVCWDGELPEVEAEVEVPDGRSDASGSTAESERLLAADESSGESEDSGDWEFYGE